MTFMTWIVNRLNYLGDFFYELYLECFYAGFPLNILDSWFLAICNLFYNLAWNFSDFFSWLNIKIAEIDKILSWDTIKGYITDWLKWLESPLSWFVNLWTQIWGEINTWWSITSSTVQGWIDIATEGLDTLLVAWSDFWTITWPEWIGKLDTLRAEWDYFWTVTFPTLVSFDWLTTWWNSRVLEVQGLIDSTLKVWFPFYDDLVALWGDIKLFFTDPEDWLYKSLDRIIERYW